MSENNAQITETYAILDRAVEAFNPSTIVACYSGGYDSMVMSHLALAWGKERGRKIILAAVDTLISADGWRDYATASAAALGADDFQIWDNPDLDHWINDVKTRGFVFRKVQHHIYFYYLKQRAFYAMTQAFKQHYHDRILFLNGIRRAESRDRRSAKEVDRRGAAVYVNPILYWQDREVDDYRAIHNLPINPFYDVFGNSGDCMCNWHIRIKLQTIVDHAPEVAKTILPLDQQNREQFNYGYGEEGKHWKRSPEEDGQMPMFEWDTDCTPNLCMGCNRPEPSNDLRDFATLQNMDWSEE